LSAVTQQNASASEELAATAEEMNAQATALQDTMAGFRLVQDGSSPSPVQLQRTAPRKSDKTAEETLPVLTQLHPEFVRF
ncbi:hypothetical protein Ga0061069_1222, partial [Thiomonas bhubaneswarensis]